MNSVGACHHRDCLQQLDLRDVTALPLVVGTGHKRTPNKAIRRRPDLVHAAGPATYTSACRPTTDLTPVDVWIGDIPNRQRCQLHPCMSRIATHLHQVHTAVQLQAWGWLLNHDATVTVTCPTHRGLHIPTLTAAGV